MICRLKLYNDSQEKELEILELGFWYDANNDSELLEQREDAEELCYFLNQTSPKMKGKREEILGALLPNRGEDTTIFLPQLSAGSGQKNPEETTEYRRPRSTPGWCVRFSQYCRWSGNRSGSVR